MIAFFTYDLLEGRERLMPWRTIIEVCKVFNHKFNRSASIYSIDKNPQNKVREFQTVNIHSVDRTALNGINFIENNNLSVIFFPVVWRSSFKSLSFLSNFEGEKIGYFPGGVYGKKQTINAIKYVGLKTCLPYLVEAFIPKSRLITALSSLGFSKLIALSELTKHEAVIAGFPEDKTYFIPPGKDETDCSINSKNLLVNGKTYNKHDYLFFMGGPAKIRGLKLLLKSFDVACQKNNDLKLVCFIRTDPGYDIYQIKQFLDKLKFKSQIEVVWQEVSREKLFNFIANAKAVVLPFLIVPSEIPLTYFEVLSLGTTIISTSNGGTTAYLSDSIFVAKSKTNSLSKTILDVWGGNKLVEEKRVNALSKMKKHPNWEQVANLWLKTISK